MVLGAIIQARMNSTRLPGKTLMQIDSYGTMLDYVIKQSSDSKIIQKVIIATTTLENDTPIVNHLKKFNVEVFRGDPENVLSRYYYCALKFKIDPIVRITADCPLIEPSIIDKVIEKFQTGEYDYVSNNKPRTFPYGMDVEIFSFKTLEIAWKNSKLNSEKEHVTPFIYKNPNKFNIGHLTNSLDISDIRITVDRENDINLIREIAKKIKNRPIRLENIIELKKFFPNIFMINQNYVTDEGYIKSLEND